MIPSFCEKTFIIMNGNEFKGSRNTLENILHIAKKESKEGDIIEVFMHYVNCKKRHEGWRKIYMFQYGREIDFARRDFVKAASK